MLIFNCLPIKKVWEALETVVTANPRDWDRRRATDRLARAGIFSFVNAGPSATPEPTSVSARTTLSSLFATESFVSATPVRERTDISRSA